MDETLSGEDRRSLGQRGEELASGYLRGRGYCIVERNYHTRRGEIDIIARQGQTVVFIEVKTARETSYGPPRSWVGDRKQARLVRAATAYLSSRQMSESDCRFDVITIEFNRMVPRLTHIVNAFTA